MFSKSNSISIKSLFFKSCSGNDKTKGSKNSDSKQVHKKQVALQDAHMNVPEVIRGSPSIYRYADDESVKATELKPLWGSLQPHKITQLHEHVKDEIKGAMKTMSLGRTPAMVIGQKEKVEPMQKIPLQISQKIPTSMDPRISPMSVVNAIPGLSVDHKISMPVQYPVPVMMMPKNPSIKERKPSVSSMGRKTTFPGDEETPVVTSQKVGVCIKEEKRIGERHKVSSAASSPQITKHDIMPLLRKPTLHIDDDDDDEERDDVKRAKTTEQLEQEKMDAAKEKELKDLEFKRRSEMNLPKYVTKIIKKSKTNLNCINVKLPDEKAKFASRICPLNIPFVCPIYKDRKVPVVLSKTVNTVYQEGSDITEVPCIKYKPYLVPVDVYVPKIVGTYLKNKKVDCKVNEQKMEEELRNKLMKKMNPHLDSLHKYNCEQQKYLDEVYGFSETIVQKRNLKLPPIRRIYKNTPRFEVFYRRIKPVDGHHA